MKKLVLFDPYLLKFSDGMVKWWSENGYEVKYSRYYDPSLVQWADVVWFDTCDNNIHMATNPPKDNPDFAGYDMHEMDLTGKKIIVRAIDIEVWQGHHASAIWDIVTDLIFIAPHIRNLVELEALPGYNPDLKVHTVSCAVDLNKWRYRHRGPGFNIAVVSERWISKGTDLILQIAMKLKKINPNYKIHWLGQRSGDTWDLAYFDDFIEHNNLNIEITNILNDGRTVDEFLDDKDYLLHASHKEAFSYATAEAMAKGIKPVVHRFYGADALWPAITWSTVDEAVDMITASDREYHSAMYKQYLINHGYTLSQMMQKFELIIKGEAQ